MARINHELREPTYDNVVVDEPIGPVTVTADEAYRRRACFALDDYSPRYLGENAPWVPAPMLGRDLVALFCSVYDPSRTVGLHQKEEIWFINPVPLNARIHYTGKYTDKYMKRGKGYTVFDTDAHDADSGVHYVRQVSTEIMRIPDDIQLGTGASAKTPRADHIRPVWPTEVTPLAHARPNMAPGTPVQPLQKRPEQGQMTVFSGGNTQWYNIHTDIEVALKAGFRDTLAQGMMETCWIAEMLARFIGDGWHTSGWIKMAYIRPVYRDDRITCKAVVDTVEDDLVNFHVWAENQHGEQTAVGWASGRLQR
ncbi:Putative dehydratase [Sodalis praecaptivus]|uniref:Putative dehydratase n=1 Tax=Sodalis praecaptivus TaxID=1239307 RepID=W0HTV4_9GAMM|nr:MaoC family dehydratase [Sodalis praecaptivus]AHF77281.1 Putative dehydratase [Sodalis praecaptivus]